MHSSASECVTAMKLPDFIASLRNAFPRIRWRSPYASFVLTCALASCAQQRVPSEAPPRVDLPLEWTEPGILTRNTGLDATWWRHFGSDELTSLVIEGQRNNLQISAAVGRVRQAQLQASIVGASLLPSVGVTANAGRQFPGLSGGAATSAGAAIEIGYEADFWGMNKASHTAAEAAWRASIYDRETVNLTVTSSIVSAYLDTLSLRDRLVIAQENVSNAEQVLRIIKAQSSAGAASSLDLARQQSIVASQKALIPDLVQRERDSRALLAILLGRSPQNLTIKETGLQGISMPQIAPGLPSELLSRRPDIRRVEAQLVAANANIAAARAALFPSIYLTGSSGMQSNSLLSLFSGSNFLTSIGASLITPIFDAGALNSARDLAIEQKKELVQVYRGVVINALSEVEKSLGLIHSLEESYNLKNVEVEQASYAFNLSKIRYQAGADDLMTVIDTQRSLSEARNQLGKIKLDRLQATVSLYKALGGGWQESGKILR